MKNPYRVLGVPEGSDMTVVKKAYRKLAKANHPDLGGDAEKFKEISEAYDAIEKGKWVPVIPKRNVLRHETLFNFSCI